MQTERIKDWKFNVQISATDDTPSPPDYDKFTLFHSEVESYAMSQTSLASTNLQKVATLTEEQDMFMPCMGCRLWPWPRVWATLAPSSPSSLEIAQLAQQGFNESKVGNRLSARRTRR